MVLRIRLARFGKKHAPFYNIVVAHARYVSALTLSLRFKNQTRAAFRAKLTEAEDLANIFVALGLRATLYL